MTTVNFSNLTKQLRNGTRNRDFNDSDSDSSSDLAERDLDDPGLGPGLTHLTPADMEKTSKHGKKTKGRVKIKMEFIENKLRRYTTFSKRKTGIMKKAYELSTLTGTQVMLLVASETGHVYTFATRKLQPMITSESGKALIQTCLNSPDIPSDSQHHSNHNPDQRMCATGFEETELSYQVSDEEALSGKEGRSAMFQVTQVPGAGADANSNNTNGLLSGAGHTFPMTTYIPTSSSAAQLASGTKVSSTAASCTPMSVPPGATITTLISPTGQALTAGQALSAGVLQVQPGHSQLQLQPNTQCQTPTATPTLYRLQQGAGLAGTASPMVTALVPSVPATTSTTSQPSQNANTVTMLTAQQSSMSPAGNTNALATPLMYHTPQGVVYAASPAGTVNTLPEGIFFNYQTAATHLHQTSHANVEGKNPATLPGNVPAIQLHVACQQSQASNTTQASYRVASTSSVQSSTLTSSKRPGDGTSDSATPAKIVSLEGKTL